MKELTLVICLTLLGSINSHAQGLTPAGGGKIDADGKLADLDQKSLSSELLIDPSVESAAMAAFEKTYGADEAKKIQNQFDDLKKMIVILPSNTRLTGGKMIAIINEENYTKILIDLASVKETADQTEKNTGFYFNIKETEAAAITKLYGEVIGSDALKVMELDLIPKQHSYASVIATLKLMETAEYFVNRLLGQTSNNTRLDKQKRSTFLN